MAGTATPGATACAVATVAVNVTPADAPSARDAAVAEAADEPRATAAEDAEAVAEAAPAGTAVPWTPWAPGASAAATATCALTLTCAEGRGAPTIACAVAGLPPRDTEQVTDAPAAAATPAGALQ